MHINKTQLPLHRIAVTTSVDVVNAVTPADLHRPTPCAGWDLADLLAHMTVQHHGFAAAARGDGADLRRWDVATVVDAVTADPAATYAAAAAEVLEAFSADGVLDATFALPEFGSGATFPGSIAISFHFADYVVHGWDVARALGVTFELPDAVIGAVLPLALAVPDGDFRAGEGAPFGPAISAGAEEPAAQVGPDDAGGDLARILRHLGRSPSWTARIEEGSTLG